MRMDGGPGETDAALTRGYLRLAGLLDAGAVAAAGGSGQDARPTENAPHE